MLVGIVELVPDNAKSFVRYWRYLAGKGKIFKHPFLGKNIEIEEINDCH